MSTGDSVNAWDALARDWDDDPAVRAYASGVFESLCRLLEWASLGLEGAHVLDFGCGTGVLTELLVEAGATVHAVDASEAMLDVLRAKTHLIASGCVVVQGALPAVTPAFDVVVCSSVCSFLENYPGVVLELSERLVPGGWFVQWDWERAPDEAGGLSPAEITEALIAAGLSGVEVLVGFERTVGELLMAPLMGSGQRPLLDGSA